MKNVWRFGCAIFALVAGTGVVVGQENDRFDTFREAFIDKGNETRVAQRPERPRDRGDAVNRRDQEGERESGRRREEREGDRPSRDSNRDSNRPERERADRERAPRDREMRPIPPGPARLDARLDAVERKLDRILEELRRIDAPARPRPPRPERDRPQPGREGPERQLNRSQFGRPQFDRPPFDRFAPLPPDAPRRDRVGPPRRPDGPPADRFERRPERRPLPPMGPGFPRNREADRPE